MKFYRANWYYIGGIYFVVLSFLMGFFGSQVSQIQTILIFSFMALLVHQFEEYGWPGGFPSIFNILTHGERQAPDRFPQNSNLSMVVNVILAYPLYISAILLPNVIWFGLATMYIGLAQIIYHGVVTNIKMKTLYNPGAAASVFLHGPIGIYYIWYVTTTGMAHASDYFIGILGLIGAMAVTVLLPVVIFSNRQTKYPFSQEEMDRFGMKEKLKKYDIPMPNRIFQKLGKK